MPRTKSNLLAPWHAPCPLLARSLSIGRPPPRSPWQTGWSWEWCIDVVLLARLLIEGSAKWLALMSMACITQEGFASPGLMLPILDVIFKAIHCIHTHTDMHTCGSGLAQPEKIPLLFASWFASFLDDAIVVIHPATRPPEWLRWAPPTTRTLADVE